MKIQVVPISSIYPNKENPRIVNKAKFEKLKKSIQDFPEMLQLRPIIVNESYIVLGGNMRYKALVELGYKEVPIIKAEDLTERQAQEFIVKDNLSFGDWDWDVLANEWDSVDLEDWGLDVWQNEDDIIAHEDTPTEDSKEEKVVCALCGK
jgi:ParB-like chromosome segregation protein Spo0J